MLNFLKIVALTKEVSAVLLRKLPPKIKDPGSFTIPCRIGDHDCEQSLLDLGAGVNLMPYTVYEKLGLGELQPTSITLQLVDRSIKRPRGILEDVLVKVGKFILPVDFIVLDMEAGPIDANQGAGHANHTRSPITSGIEFAQDPLSLPSGPITRLRAKRFKETLNGLIQENGADSKKTKMGSNNNQGLVHVIKGIDEVN
jgi:hypothetical protein